MEPEGPVVGLQDALASVDEVAQIAVGVAKEVGRGLREPGEVDPYVLVPQQRLPRGGRVPLVGGSQAVEIEGPGPEVALDADPGRGRMGPVELRRPALEGVAAMLLLVGPCGQAHLGLAGGSTPE